ncbi:MAG: hypothetical protein AAGN66_04930 [Acidobacteriota bacterium]
MKRAALPLPSHRSGSHLTSRPGKILSALLALPLLTSGTLFAAPPEAVLADDAWGSYVSRGADWWFAEATADDGGASLTLTRGTGNDITPLPAPTLEGGMALQPTPLVAEGGLEGMVWLEGASHDTLAVRASAWSGNGWSAPLTVAPAGDGSQVALQAGVLDNGEWLAVWAAHDGKDDEIVWSRFDGTAWSAPSPVTQNAVPDVTPSLRTLPSGGALVVWSGYDGNDYRLHAARFDGDGWGEAQRFGGKGSVIPAFARTDERLVVHRQVIPRGWVITELDDRGLPVRSATVDANMTVRPKVLETGNEGLRVAWPGSGERSSAVELPWQTSQ